MQEMIKGNPEGIIDFNLLGLKNQGSPTTSCFPDFFSQKINVKTINELRLKIRVKWVSRFIFRDVCKEEAKQIR